MAKGKGIIKETPTVTTPKGIVIAVYSDPGSGVFRGAELLFDDNPAVRLAPGDAIEFDIIDSRNCRVISKLTSPTGTVPDPQLMQLRVTNPDPNDFGVRMDQTLSYAFLESPDPFTIDRDDNVQFIAVDNNAHCIIVKKV